MREVEGRSESERERERVREEVIFYRNLELATRLG